MLKPLGQAAALILLCALLVYAPEIYTAVSGPFSLSTPERVLLRVVLCTQDDETVASFYSDLTQYQKLHPAVHLRVVRTDAAQLSGLQAPLPDVYLFEEDSVLPQAQGFHPLNAILQNAAEDTGEDMRYALAYRPGSGRALWCAASAQSKELETALDFISYFYEIPAKTPGQS